MQPVHFRHRRVRLLLVVGVALLSAPPAFALYKVVGPDGRVTYTDRPPAIAGGERVLPLGRAVEAPGPVAPQLHVAAVLDGMVSGHALEQVRAEPHAGGFVTLDGWLGR